MAIINNNFYYFFDTMFRKYIIRKPNENRMKILEFCTKKCEFSNRCFSLPLSNCCVKKDEINKILILIGNNE